MPLLEWSDEFSCNVKDIDDQHRSLIGMLNELHRAMINGTGQETVASIIGQMMDYTSYHFSTEERYMALHSYPGLIRHRSEHQDFVRAVSRFRAQYEAGRIGLSIDVLRFLSSWLLNHIQGSDRSLGPFLNARGVCGYGAQPS
jgi:hemerythrin